jgi:hypothetical protein
LYFNRLLIGHKKYLVFFSIIIGFVLSSILGITSILRIRNSYIIIRLIIKINRFLITSIRGYPVFMLFDIVS